MKRIQRIGYCKQSGIGTVTSLVSQWIDTIKLVFIICA